jgi:O-methyltransferase involved in polyketide biosynthesis
VLRAGGGRDFERHARLLMAAVGRARSGRTAISKQLLTSNQRMTHNERSSFTANALALRRTFTGIPLSQEIFDILQAEQLLSPADIERAMSTLRMTPFFEARYVVTDQVIAERGLRQVFELAAGLSPRGAAMTVDPGVNFLEADLAEKSALKKRLIEKLVAGGSISARPNLHLLRGNVTGAATFRQAEALLREEPVAVVCEGLLRYVSFPDKEILGRHVHELLQKFGGVWITPDIEFSPTESAPPERQERYRRMAAAGVDVRPNLFADKDHAVAFFENLGFAVTSIPLAQAAGRLVSPKRLNLGVDEVARALENRMTFVMTVLG